MSAFSSNCWHTLIYLQSFKQKQEAAFECHTKMKPFPSFVMWDQNRLQFQVWYYQGLNPVRHWVQLREKMVHKVTQLLCFLHISLYVQANILYRSEKTRKVREKLHTCCVFIDVKYVTNLNMKNTHFMISIWLWLYKMPLNTRPSG